MSDHANRGLEKQRHFLSFSTSMDVFYLYPVPFSGCPMVCMSIVDMGMVDMVHVSKIQQEK